VVKPISTKVFTKTFKWTISVNVIHKNQYEASKVVASEIEFRFWIKKIQSNINLNKNLLKK